jgi:6-phosphogluconate dehydrogenase
MEEQQYKYGMIGLGTMGCNLVLNMSDHGFSVAGYDKSQSQVDHLNTLAEGRQVKGFNDMAAFVKSLETPRVIMLLVPAGAIVNAHTLLIHNYASIILQKKIFILWVWVFPEAKRVQGLARALCPAAT